MKGSPRGLQIPDYPPHPTGDQTTEENREPIPNLVKVRSPSEASPPPGLETGNLIVDPGGEQIARPQLLEKDRMNTSSESILENTARRGISPSIGISKHPHFLSTELDLPRPESELPSIEDVHGLPSPDRRGIGRITWQSTRAYLAVPIETACAPASNSAHDIQQFDSGNFKLKIDLENEWGHNYADAITFRPVNPHLRMRRWARSRLYPYFSIPALLFMLGLSALNVSTAYIPFYGILVPMAILIIGCELTRFDRTLCFLLIQNFETYFCLFQIVMNVSMSLLSYSHDGSFISTVLAFSLFFIGYTALIFVDGIATIPHWLKVVYLSCGLANIVRVFLQHGFLDANSPYAEIPVCIFFLQ